MLYLNENMTNDEWIRISSVTTLSSKSKKRSSPKIEKLSLRKINSSSSSSSSSSFSSFSDTHELKTNQMSQKCLIYKKSLNKSRNFFNSSSETLSKLAYKKRKLKLNRIIDDFDKSSRTKSEKRIRSKSNRESRHLKRSTSSELNTQLSKTKSIKPTKTRLKSVDNDIVNDRYNSYGLIPLIPRKYNRPALPAHCRNRYFFIEPPLKHRIVPANSRQNRSRSSPKISVFYSVEYESPDDMTNNSIVDTLSKTTTSLINKTKILDETLNTVRIKTKISPMLSTEKVRKLKDIDGLKKSKKLIQTIGDRPDKPKNYYLPNITKVSNDSINFSSNSINSNTSSVQSINKNSLKKNLKPIINNTNNNYAKTVVDNYQYDIDKSISKFNQIKELDTRLHLKEIEAENSYQRITRQNRIIFYEDKANQNDKIKYEANLPHLPEELKNAMKSIFDSNNTNNLINSANSKPINSVKSPLTRKKFIFNSISKSINQDILENLSVILEEENTLSSKNSSSVNSNAFNINNTSNTNSTTTNTKTNKSDSESNQENTISSSNKLEDEIFIGEKSISLSKSDTKLDKSSRNLLLEKNINSTDKLIKIDKSIDQTQIKKDEMISNAFKYLIAKETEDELNKKLHLTKTNSGIQLNELNGNQIIGLRAESKTEIICI